VAGADAFNRATVVGSAGTLPQPAAIIPATTNEAILIAYADQGNAVGVTPNPTALVAGGTTSNPFSVNAHDVLLCTELFYSPYPFGTASVNALADYWINSTTQRLLALAQDGVVYKSSVAPSPR